MPKDEATAMSQSSKDKPATTSQSSKDKDVVELNILTKFINKFDGSRENLTAFLNNCKNAISLTSTAQQGILLKYILSQLEGRAQSACSIKEFDNYQQFEDFLKSQFGERKHYAALLSDLQECRQSNSETVNQFALRIESCLAKLLTEINISIPTKKKAELAGRLAAMQDLALHTFVIGLNMKLSTVVRCRDPETLNDAINFATSEEKILQATFRRNAPTANIAASTQNHRFPQQKQQFQQNKSFKPNNNQESTSAAPVCRYCKNIGHTLENCRKRQFNNNRNRNGNHAVHAVSHDDATNARCYYNQNTEFYHAQSCESQPAAGRDEGSDPTVGQDNLND